MAIELPHERNGNGADEHGHRRGIEKLGRVSSRRSATAPPRKARSWLEGDAIVEEVARMLGGLEGDETALRHAAAMLG